MKKLLIAVVALAVAVSAVAADVAANRAPDTNKATPHAHTMAAAGTTTAAADLRVTLDRLLSEHVFLALNATQRGLTGDKDFNAAAKALDANSVAIANAIGSVYGQKARNQFLNGKFLWRAHIGFFVDYTVATAKKDKAGQAKAVNNLKTYIGAFSSFLAQATGLPQKALAAGTTEHVMQLKGAVDAYAAGNYAKAYRLEREGAHHMVMTGDLLAGAIAKKFPAKFGA